MTIKGIRFCLVADEAELIAEQMMDKDGFAAENSGGPQGNFSGAVFQAGDSRIEVWPGAEAMRPVSMLHIVVASANEWSEKARGAGARIKGPFSAHGECIYSLELPGEMVVSVQSKEPSHAE